MTQKVALLSAGGTGGHLFPAQALAHELIARGWSVHLATDERGTRYTSQFPGDLHVIASATFGSKNPIALLKTAKALFDGYRQSKKLLSQLKPSVVVGFGGYPTIPPVMAAQRSGVPSVLHEQNAVLGRANRLLEKRATAIAAGFSGAGLPNNAIITGNPLRPEILEIVSRLDKADAPYVPSLAGQVFNLLVIGGSQGAQYFGETVPAALAQLGEDKRSRVRLVLQAREEQVETAQAVLQEAGIDAEVAPFFGGMGPRLEAAHLMICRAGASTVSEIAAMGRPSILVPYPFALDHDQAANARELVDRGGGVVEKQSGLTAERLSQLIAQAMDEPERLAKQAHAAAMTGKPNATDQLADLVVEVGKGRYSGAGIAVLPHGAGDAGDRVQG